MHSTQCTLRCLLAPPAHGRPAASPATIERHGCLISVHGGASSRRLGSRRGWPSPVESSRTRQDRRGAAGVRAGECWLAARRCVAPTVQRRLTMMSIWVRGPARERHAWGVPCLRVRLTIVTESVDGKQLVFRGRVRMRKAQFVAVRGEGERCHVGHVGTAVSHCGFLCQGDALQTPLL